MQIAVSCPTQQPERGRSPISRTRPFRGVTISTVSLDGGFGQPATPPLPTEIKVLAWASLAGQVVMLARQGLRSDDDTAISMLLGAVIVGYVAAGVVRARPVRVALAWIVLVLSLVGELVELAYVDAFGDAVIMVAALTTTVVALVALSRFRRTDWYVWQRTRPPRDLGAPIGGLVAIAVLVGVLGGVAGASDNGVRFTVRVAEE